MTDLIIILIIAAALIVILRIRKKDKAAGASCCSGETGGTTGDRADGIRGTAGNFSCGGSCAGCSGCDSIGRMGGTPLPAKKTDYSDRKIVFFDIDGTILDGATHTIPESTVRAIRRLRENGNLAFLNTGRTLASIAQDIRDIGFDGYVCGCGTHIYQNGKTICSHTIPHEKCVEIIHTLRRLRVSAFFEAEGAVYIDRDPSVCSPAMDQVRIDFAQVGLKTSDFPEDLEHSDFTFDKFYCIAYEKSDFEGLKEYVKEEFTATPQGAGNLEIVPAGCSKAEGIYFLQKKYGISLDHCYAIGDSENDLPMLKAVPHSIAMGVCAPAILPYCSYQTAPVMEDGIEKALAHYGLI